MITKKKILLILISLILLGGAAAGIYYISQFEELPPEEDPDTSLTIDYQRETLQIYTCDIENVDRIQVKNQSGEYTVSRDENGTVYFYGHKDVPLLPYSSEGLFESVKNIRCDAIIETDCTEFHKYGLEEPQVVINVIMKSGKESVFHLGDAAPQGGGYYFRDTTNNDVYLSGTYFSERFVKNHTAYYETTVSKEFEYSGFQTLSVKPAEGEELLIRTTTEEEIKDIQFIGGTVMEKPFFASGTSEPIQEIVDLLATLKASRVETDVLNQENLAKYGFDSPTEVKITTLVNTSSYISNITSLENPYYDPNGNGEDKLIEIFYVIGKTVDNTTYVMFDSRSVIYAVDKSAFEWLNLNTIDVYCLDNIFVKNINDLAKLTVRVEGKTHVFDITDPDLGDEMTVSYGTYTPINQAQFRQFYVSIIGLTHDGLAYEPEAGLKPYMSITFTPIEGEEILLEYYQVEPRKYVIKVNGEGRFFTYSTKVDKIVKNLNKLLNNEEITN